jgi:hypothetical protein
VDCLISLPRLWDLLFLIPFLTPPYIAALSWMLVLQTNGYLPSYRLGSQRSAVQPQRDRAGDDLNIFRWSTLPSPAACWPAGSGWRWSPGCTAPRLASLLAYHAADAFAGAGGRHAAGVYPGD